jgi:acyl-CoA reductase-like NAD-dependent aldehyde dehydrogenase
MTTGLQSFRMLIGGKAVGAISGRTFESENPYTGRSWAVVPDGGPADVDAAGPESTVVREEIFGPVLSAYTFTDEDEALKLADDTFYGLAGAAWTKDIHRAHRVAAKLRAGTV